jgi:RNA polymerase sigma factor (sigma-70 family)
MAGDKELIKLLRDGNEIAWRSFIDEFKDKVFRTALSYIPFPEEAEDLTQEVFVEVFQRLDKFREESGLSTWIYRITVNKAINHLKKNRKYHLARPRDDFLIAEPSKTDGIPDASHAFQQKESRKIIHEAILSLPERQTMVFVLHKIQGRSYREISDILQISLPSVESLMHRAKSALQKKLFVLYRQYHK